jgi:hypothetical protein
MMKEKSVLIVDDEKNIRLTYQGPGGFKVDTAPPPMVKRHRALRRRSLTRFFRP